MELTGADHVLQFGWGVEETSYWTSFNSLAKLATLLFAIPLATRTFRPSPPQPDRPRPGMDGVVNPRDEGQAAESAFSVFSRVVEDQEDWDREQKRLQVETEAAFDLKLATGSMLLAILGYALMANPRATEVTFLVATAVCQFSGGVVPALQSLALSVSSPRDSGRLLAGLSCLASASMQVIGPGLFGAILAGTLDGRPEVVWAGAAVWWVLALVPVGLVKIGGEVSDGDGERDDEAEL